MTILKRSYIRVLVILFVLSKTFAEIFKAVLDFERGSIDSTLSETFPQYCDLIETLKSNDIHYRLNNPNSES